MRRLHRRLFRINDLLADLAVLEETLLEELDMHRSINDDAQTDAALGNYIDREEAQLTSGDVARFEKAIIQVRERRQKLDVTRLRLLEKLENS